jgi:hypothetical protein
MPNWTANIIRAEGAASDIQGFLKAIRGPEQILDFDRLVPMPEILRHTISGRRDFDGKTYDAWFVENPDADFTDQIHRPFTPDEIDILAEIGFTDWYHWAVDHWGTKWNACRASLQPVTGDDGVIEIHFDTAWAAPFPIFKKIAETFPTLSFEFSWTDEDDPDVTHQLCICRREPSNREGTAA